MSEYLDSKQEKTQRIHNNHKELKQQLLAYARGLHEGKIHRAHYDQYQNSLVQAGPQDVNWLVDRLVQENPGS